MLVLTRKTSESIQIGDGITLKVIRCGKGSVKLGIDAPADVRVLRGELVVADAADEDAADMPAPHADAPTRAIDFADDRLPAAVACGGYFPLPHTA